MRRRTTKLARCIPLVFLVGAAQMIAPAGASAATQIGETFTPPDGCGSGITFIQSTSAGSKYAVPSDGIITSFGFQAAADPPALKFKVARPIGADSFTIVGESALATPAANSLISTPAQIPVKAGDVLGFFISEYGQCRGAVAGYNYHSTAGDVLPGVTSPFILNPIPPQILDVSAALEADCDRDGRGDETQDTSLTSCLPAKPAVTGLQAAALKKCKKKARERGWSHKKLKKCKKKARALPI